MDAIEPYLFYEGRCEEAIGFYRRALGAEVAMLVRYRDAPAGAAGPNPPPADKIMHATLSIGGATMLMSDGHCEGAPRFGGFGLSLRVEREADVDRLYAALVEGGQPRMPPSTTFFSPRFAMAIDRFGVLWMLMMEKSR